MSCSISARARAFSASWPAGPAPRASTPSRSPTSSRSRGRSPAPMPARIGSSTSRSTRPRRAAERVDVVVCDQIGRFRVRSRRRRDFADARTPVPQADGRLVPAAVELWVTAVECPEAFAQIEFWNTRPAGVDVTPARSLAANTGYPRHLKAGDLLAPPVCAARADLTRDVPMPLRLNARLEVARAGTLHGLGGWFVAQLAPGVRMTNSPLAPDRINRRNVFLPFDHPVAVMAGDRVECSLQALPGDSVLGWQADVSSAHAPDRPRAHFAHSTWRGMLIDSRRARAHAAGAPAAADGSRPRTAVGARAGRRPAHRRGDRGGGAAGGTPISSRPRARRPRSWPKCSHATRRESPKRRDPGVLHSSTMTCYRVSGFVFASGVAFPDLAPIAGARAEARLVLTRRSIARRGPGGITAGACRRAWSGCGSRASGRSICSGSRASPTFSCHPTRRSCDAGRAPALRSTRFATCFSTRCCRS